MNQMFFGNARVMLFTPNGGSTPSTREVTRIWWSNDESDFSDCPSNNGTFDSSCFPEGKNNYDAVKVEFGLDVTSIADQLFIYSNLTTVIIPDSITTIGTEVFLNCENLYVVKIIANGGNAAAVKQMLTNDSNFPSQTSIIMPSHSDTRVIYDEGLGENNWSGEISGNIYSYSDIPFHEYIKEIDFGNTVTSIGAGGFSSHQYLKTVVINNEVTTIYDGAFAADNISKLVIPDSVSYIGEYSFAEIDNVVIVANGGDENYIKQMVPAKNYFTLNYSSST